MSWLEIDAARVRLFVDRPEFSAASTSRNHEHRGESRTNAPTKIDNRQCDDMKIFGINTGSMLPCRQQRKLDELPDTLGSFQRENNYAAVKMVSNDERVLALLRGPAGRFAASSQLHFGRTWIYAKQFFARDAATFGVRSATTPTRRTRPQIKCCEAVYYFTRGSSSRV